MRYCIICGRTSKYWYRKNYYICLGCYSKYGTAPWVKALIKIERRNLRIQTEEKEVTLSDIFEIKV